MRTRSISKSRASRHRGDESNQARRRNTFAKFPTHLPKRCVADNLFRFRDRQETSALRNFRRRRAGIDDAARLNREYATSLAERIAANVASNLCRRKLPTDADRDLQFPPAKAPARQFPMGSDANEFLRAA